MDSNDLRRRAGILTENAAIGRVKTLVDAVVNGITSAGFRIVRTHLKVGSEVELSIVDRMKQRYSITVDINQVTQMQPSTGRRDIPR